jgi:hypothetical protein
MQKIKGVGKIDDLLVEGLKNRLEKTAESVTDTQETQLEDRRKKLDQSPPEANPEQWLDSDQSNRVDTESDPDDSENGLTEARLRSQGTQGGNADLNGITQARLEKASTDAYPHRNPESWERTGQKRPVNNLDEEMRDTSDESRIDRMEKHEKSAQDQPERIVDKDVGKQLETKASFNLRQARNAKKYAGHERYIAYKNSQAGEGGSFSGRTVKLQGIDDKLAAIMSKEQINEEDQKAILALKKEKTALLWVPGGLPG